MIALLLFFEKKGKRIRKMIEMTIKGKCGTQSFKIPYTIAEKEPRSWRREGIHDRLTVVIQTKKKKPGKTEEENDAVED